MSLIIARDLRPPPPQPSALPSSWLNFITNNQDEQDGAAMRDLPSGFGAGEFTFEVSLWLDNTAAFGDVTVGDNERTAWATNDATIYTNQWWFRGNFIIDGHNNSSGFSEGTFSLQSFRSGRLRWTFGDDSVSIPTGGVWGIQPATNGTNVRDSQWHKLALVRRWSDTPANSADLEMWIDGSLEATENTPDRVNMWTTFWQNWTGYPVNQDGWFLGGEKQVVLNPGNYEDHKGRIARPAFFNGAKSAGELAVASHVIDTGHSDYMDHWEMDEGTGLITRSEVGSLPINLDTGNVNVTFGS